MSNSPSINRRAFIKTSVTATGGLLVGFYLPFRASTAEGAAEPDAVLAPNAWIRIGKDNSVTFLVGQTEMGQGVATSLPMLLAEELEVDWSKVRFEAAPADLAYAIPDFHMQLTGGSMSIRTFYQPLRQAGAATRELLIGAAAQTWNVPENTCRAQKGFVVHTATNRQLAYGALVDKAAAMPVPKSPKLKNPKDFTLIGKPTRRLDTPAKVNGSAIFGIDVRQPG